jgi:hypothetical protein
LRGIDKLRIVEESGRPLADAGVHAVLLVQHEHPTAPLLPATARSSPVLLSHETVQLLCKVPSAPHWKVARRQVACAEWMGIPRPGGGGGREAYQLQPLKEAASEAGLPCCAGYDGGRQLLWISHQHGAPPRHQHLQWDQRCWLHRLCRLRPHNFPNWKTARVHFPFSGARLEN